MNQRRGTVDAQRVLEACRARSADLDPQLRDRLILEAIGETAEGRWFTITTRDHVTELFRAVYMGPIAQPFGIPNAPRWSSAVSSERVQLTPELLEACDRQLRTPARSTPAPLWCESPAERFARIQARRTA